ncbi:hypothetical protein ROS217_00445 [Roseovarius sp. 217]|nr:hypothetical protein ROS217_00445 [Roseovarius sp. 217]
MLHDSATIFAERVTDLTDGQFQIRAEHVTHCQNLDRITIAELQSGDEDVEFRALPDDILNALKASAEKHLKIFSDESEDFARIYDNYNKFSTEIRALQNMTVYPLERQRNS